MLTGEFSVIKVDILSDGVSHGALLLTWINFNTSMDK